MPNPGKAEPGVRHPKGKCDVFHLNESGEYFQALVWTAKLFHADVTKGTYRPDGVTAEEAALMRRVVRDTVFAN